MERVQGQRAGRSRFIHDGHAFHYDSRYDPEEEEFVCSCRTTLWRCRVTVSIGPDGEIFISGDHEHPPYHTQEDLRRQQMVLELRRQATLSRETLEEILDRVSQKYVLKR